MPIAATGQPMTREPRSCPRETRTCTRETRTCTRLPATPEPVPKGAELLFDETPPEPTEYGAFERDRLGPGGYSDYSPGAIGIIQPGSTHGSSPQTLSPPPPPAPPPLPSPFLHHTHHHTHNPYEPQLMAMDMAPRTRLRSRSGYYQQYGSVNSNGTTSTGVMVGAHHHHHHPYQLHHQQQQQQQQHNAVCAQLAYNNNNNNNNNHHHHQSENQANQTPSGDNSSSVIQRLAAPTGAHLISAEGAVRGPDRCHPDHAYGEERDKIEDRPSPKRQRLSSQQLTPVVTPPPSTMPSPPIRPWELGYPSRRPPMPPQVCHRCSTPGTHQAGCPARSPFHQSPGAHQHPNLQNPGAHQHPNLQHPNLQHPGAHQNPNLQNPNLQNPGALQHPNLQNPGAQHAPLDRQSFAEELLAQPLIPLPYPHPHHLNAAQQQQDAMVRSLHEQHPGAHHAPLQHQSFAEELLAQPLIPLPHPHHHHLNAAQQQQDAMVRNLHEQVLQACTGTHLPMPFTFSSMMSRDPHFLLASQTQLAPGTFLPYQAPPPRSPLQQFETEVELLIEQMSVAGGYNYRHQQRHLHQNATPMQLFTNLDPVPQPYSPYTPRHTARRYNSQHPMPPAPHPSSFLPYISHPGTSNMGSFASVDDGEVENYEALLNLAERLGEAMPRGLTTADIDQLPSYRFNPSSHQSEQTMCVVCMCDYETCQLLRVLPCNHQFHSKCVDKWLKANRTCPICRADSSKVQTHSE